MVQRKPLSELPKMEIVNLQLQTPGSSYLDPLHQYVSLLMTVSLFWNILILRYYNSESFNKYLGTY